jgi:hypothetical protein
MKKLVLAFTLLALGVGLSAVPKKGNHPSTAATDTRVLVDGNPTPMCVPTPDQSCPGRP